MKKVLGLVGAAMVLAGPALAADLAVKAPLMPLAPVSNWTGWYLGGNIGYHWGGETCVNTVTTNISSVPGLNGNIGGAVAAQGTGSVCPDDRGIVGGAQVGYNLQFSNWVAGIEADIQAVSNGDDQSSITNLGTVPHALTPISSTGTITSTKDLDWLGTVRGRFGFLLAPTFLVYGTGGLAYGDVTASTSIVEKLGFSDTPNTFGTAGTFSGTRVGWTAGGGVEWMFIPKWSLKAEYLYYNLGTETWSLGNINQTSTLFGLETVGASQSSTRFSGQIVRAGVNYHF